MSERLVNIFAAITSTFLIVMYFVYTFTGRPFDIHFAVIPLAIIASTYTLLAYHQIIVVRYDGEVPFAHPVPWRWVVAFKYVGFSILAWFVIMDILWPMPMEPELRRFVWLSAALIHVWFLRRFVIWNRPEETKHARDIRQEATDVRQDERDVTQDTRERKLYRAEDH